MAAAGAAMAIFLAWLTLRRKAANEAAPGTSAPVTSSPVEESPGSVLDPQITALVERAELLFSQGRMGEAMDVLVAAYRLDVSSTRALEVLSAYQNSFGGKVPKHVKTAIKASMSRFELVLYSDLYDKGQLQGEDNLLGLAKLKMLYHPLHDPNQALSDVMSASGILSAIGEQGASQQVKRCKDYAQGLQERLRHRVTLTHDLEVGSSAQELASRLLPEPSFESVDRRANLSMEEYRHLYVEKRRPVIITDYAEHTLPRMEGATDQSSGSTRAWGWEEMLQVCGDMNVTLSQRHPEARHLWAGLGISRNSKFAEWIGEIREGRAANATYLMDHGLAGRCSAFLEHFVVPKYFAGDLFKRLSFNENGGRDMFPHHPSVFAGAAGSGGSLHVDSHASTFWQLLLRGRKRWTLYSLPDSLRRVLLYAGVEHEVLPLVPLPGEVRNLSRTPLLAVADAFKVVVEVKAGDLIMVPHDVPHMVENVEDVLAISMNVLDDVAVPRLIEDLHARSCFSSDEALLANLRVLQKAAETQSADSAASPIADARDVPFAEYQRYGPLSG